MLMDRMAPLSLPWRHFANYAPWLWRFALNAFPGNRRHTIDRLIQLNEASLPAWKRLLPDDMYSRIFLERGMLDVVAVNRPLDSLVANAQALGVEGVPIELLDASQVAELEPLLSGKVAGATLHSAVTQVTDPKVLSDEMMAVFTARGGTLVRMDVSDVRSGPDNVEVVGGGQSCRAKRAVISAGWWSPAMLKRFSLRAPLRAERGYHVMLPTGTPAEVARQVLVLPFNDETAALELIRRHAHKLAAIVIDTMPSRAGMICMTSSFCQMLRDACSRYGIVLIDDEVMSLRSGYAGGLGNLGVQADLTALGKIIGGGLPIGAVAGSAEIMQVFSGTRGNGKVTSSGTYSANPVSLSAGIAALNLLTKEAIANMEEMAIRLREEGSELLGKVGLWPCVRGAGSLFKFVLKEGPISWPRESVMTKHEQIMQDTFVRAMLDRGIWITASGTACLSTAMTQADITTFLDAACESLELAKAV